MTIMDKFSSITDFFSNFREFIYGENNSRIDYLLDYFFSLRQGKRAKVILYAFSSLLIFTVLIVLLYFWGIHSLQVRLSQATSHIEKLVNIEPSFMAINQEFNKLSTSLQENNQYTTIVNALVQKSKDLGIDAPTFPEKPTLIDLQNNDPFYGKFQRVNLDYKIQNISLTKIIDYIDKIQLMDNKFKIIKFEIQQKFGTKLYFDLNLSLQTYIPISKTAEGL